MCEIFTIIGQYLDVRCYVASDKSECPSGYWDNDMMKIHFIADLPKNFNAKTDALLNRWNLRSRAQLSSKALPTALMPISMKRLVFASSRVLPDQIVKKFDAAFKKVKVPSTKIKDEVFLTTTRNLSPRKATNP